MICIKKFHFSVKCEGGLTDDFDTTVGVNKDAF